MANNQCHSPILIAISWQALNRALARDPGTQECDCAVVIVFAGFYLEADLNDLIHRLGRESDMRAFLRRPHPGLQDKLAWFYNEYVARSKTENRDELFERGVEQKLRRRFPGFAELYRLARIVDCPTVGSTVGTISPDRPAPAPRWSRGDVRAG